MCIDAMYLHTWYEPGNLNILEVSQMLRLHVEFVTDV